MAPCRGPVSGDSGGNQPPDIIETKPFHRHEADMEMAFMCGIERAAEKTDAQPGRDRTGGLIQFAPEGLFSRRPCTPRILPFFAASSGLQLREPKRADLANAVSAHSRHQQNVFAGCFFKCRFLACKQRRRNRVDLVQDDDLRLVGNAMTISYKFTADRTIGLHDCAFSPSTTCRTTAQRSAWPRKRSPKTRAFMRAFDQPGKIGEHEINLVAAHHFQVAAPAW